MNVNSRAKQKCNYFKKIRKFKIMFHALPTFKLLKF